jgi:hypothetical protein
MQKGARSGAPFVDCYGAPPPQAAPAEPEAEAVAQQQCA